MKHSKKVVEQNRDEAIKWLRAHVKPEQKVYTVLRQRGRNGTTHYISVFIAGWDAITDITYWVARAIDAQINPRNGGICMEGGGMDFGHAIVYQLAGVIYPDADPLGRNLRQVWL